ncbi:MAG: methyltransferase, RsmD family [Bacteroidota bacterium]|jgi:16S rRNA (guanine(966)-N(2))-methyltransferase RsmD|nr:methyltransferase, RsmD family [Bacteroidota bacterium]
MIRIISGTHKSRVVHAPKNLPVRPTTDFAKESIFNILNNHFEFEGLKVLDLFSGTGNITYEFLSRGSTDIISVDDSYLCTSFIKKTIEAFKLPKARVIKADAFSFLKNNTETYDIIFADPPYDLEKIPMIAPLVFEKGLLRKNGWLIVEHGPSTDLSNQEHFKEKRKYGNVNFAIFRIEG